MSRKQRRTTLPKSTRFKEASLLILAGVLAAVSIYSAYEPDSALGLVDRAVFAQTPVFITPVQFAVFEDEQFLDLDIPTGPTEPGEQVGGNWFDPSNPPAIVNPRVLNTRIGSEALLTWERPEGVDAVTIKRRVKDSSVKAESVVKEYKEQTYVDTDLDDGETYEYEFYAVVYFDDETYIANEAAIAFTYVQDEIAPAAPTNVVVTNTEYDTQYTTKSGLLITWENSVDTDVEQVKLYRSNTWGSRGKLIESFELEDEELVAEYHDKTAEAHEVYYYTVVAVDTAGNESTADFDLPPVGNSKPFEPFTNTVEETDS